MLQLQGCRRLVVAEVAGVRNGGREDLKLHTVSNMLHDLGQIPVFSEPQFSYRGLSALNKVFIKFLNLAMRP